MPAPSLTGNRSDKNSLFAPSSKLAHASVPRGALTVLMEQTLVVLKRKSEKLLHPFDMEQFFLRTWDGRDLTCRVATLPTHKHIIQANLPAEALAGLKKLPLRFELDIILMTTPVNDVSDGEPPFFPILLLMADSESGMVVGIETLSTVDGIEAAYARMPEVITGLLRKAKVVPETLAARHPILVSILEAFHKSYAIHFEYDAELSAATEASQSVMGFMSKGFR